MDQTFNRLVARSNLKEQSKIGDPWEVIPIKNRKQARDTTEIHLGQRGLEMLKEFENFPNIEVLYLNDNRMERVEGLDTNFRLKHLYLFNNKLKTLEGSLANLNHLETLLLYKNELRDLDLNLSRLEHLTNLKQLDLFENPLADEPHYRLRVVYALPSVVVLDRHVVTNEERAKAKKFIEDDANYVRKKGGQEKKVHKIAPSAMFSRGEKVLYQEAATIKAKKLEETRKLEESLQLQRTAKQIIVDPTKVPVSREKAELERRRREEPLSLISEWDKSRLTPLFKSLDKDKKAAIPLERLGELYRMIQSDDGIVGKVLSCSEQEFIDVLSPSRELTEAGAEPKNVPTTLSWDDFRFSLNKFIWVKPDEAATNKRIKDLYYKANKKIYGGELPAAMGLLYKAIKIESELGATETHKVLLKKAEKEEKKTLRVDAFDFGKYTFKNSFSSTQKYLL